MTTYKGWHWWWPSSSVAIVNTTITCLSLAFQVKHMNTLTPLSLSLENVLTTTYLPIQPLTTHMTSLFQPTFLNTLSTKLNSSKDNVKGWTISTYIVMMNNMYSIGLPSTSTLNTPPPPINSPLKSWGILLFITSSKPLLALLNSIRIPLTTSLAPSSRVNNSSMMFMAIMINTSKSDRRIYFLRTPLPLRKYSGSKTRMVNQISTHSLTSLCKSMPSLLKTFSQLLTLTVGN